MCIDVFGKQFTRDKIDENVRRTNLYYDGNTNYHGSNVVMAYGSIDLWNILGSYTYDSSHNLFSYLINGKAHFADLYPPRETNPVDLPNESK
uniref:Lyase_8 domain-containing protein n=1 Tax=Strongyloides papillosus TaxID=174720 RepID=A0A0N5B7D1_STREA